MIVRCTVLFTILGLAITAPAQQPPLVLKNDSSGWRAEIDPQKGSLQSLSFHHNGQSNIVRFRADQFAGPGWVDVPMQFKDTNSLTLEGHNGDVVYSLRYQSVNGHFALIAGLENTGTNVFAPKQARLRLGVDTEMIRFPQWNEVLFPTLLRCEKTHFWGYFMGPSGRILAIASPDPIASYQLEYNQSGHRIFTADLDLLHATPLPSRHPQNCSELKPGERRTWTIYLDTIESLDALKPGLAELTKAPMIEAERYTLAEGEKTRIRVWSPDTAKVSFDTPTSGAGTTASERDLKLEPDGTAGVWRVEFSPKAGPGVYTLTASTAGGKRAEAKIHVRRPWSWYLQRAADEALAKPQKASTHRESWIGCFSTILAQRYFPQPTRDVAAEKMFQELFGLMYDATNAKPLAVSDPGRSQNHSVMISLLSMRYSITGNTNDLDFAARLADWLIANRQADDGSYRARSKTGVHYTSVHYMAKNILELATQEKKLAAADPRWRERYERHYQSARRAVDDLLNRGDRVETEGEQTFEDSMVANTAAQLALFALMQTNTVERAKYAKAAAHMHDEHRCLSQLEIPDCRMRGGSLRFWESQYDVLMKPNMVNSPHGWTGRKTPGTWYLYLLTGEERYLRDTMDAVGACMQLIDANSGELRWAFVPDPYVEADVFEPDPDQPGRGRRVKRIIGEQYVPMISHWWKAPPGQAVRGYSTTIPGSACDNDVHEVFKAMAEIALTAGYVLERANGEIVSWNCTVQRDGNVLKVSPSEAVVNRVHFNFRTKHAVRVEFKQGAAANDEFDGMRWVGPGGVPELLR